MADQGQDPGSQYNTMQQQAGLIPPFAAPIVPVIFPGQVSAAMAQGQGGAFSVMRAGQGGPVGNAGFGSGAFPGQQYPTFTSGPSLFQGPTGAMMPQMPGAPFNPYGGGGGQPGSFGATPFSPQGAYAPPAYAGFQGHAPFGPQPSASMYMTPYQGQLAQREAAGDRDFTNAVASMGIGARMSTNMLAGVAGAAVGSRFGMLGAAMGGVAGFVGAEAAGVGRAGQNAFQNWFASPAINRQAYGVGIEQASQGFLAGGPFMHASGSGFSRQASMDAARQLEDMATSTSFRRQTFNRFNTSDVMQITQQGAEAGLFQGVGSPTQMRDRARDVAKSVSTLMELAHDPDISHAIQTMGNLRASGLNLNETMTAVRGGRTFARMAGQTFEQMASTGGAMGGQTYQSMGMGQGLGFQVGMGNLGQAIAAQRGGILGPGTMGLMGGPQGYAGLNNMFSASMMQLPMMVPGMMGAGGGLNAGAIQGLMGGRSNLFSQTGAAAGTLGQITGRFGVEGLGGAIAMQPMLQAQLGQMLENQGPFARRNVEDRQVVEMMRQMGMHGSQGYMTVAQTLGMDRTQAMARAQEMSDPRHFQRMREQIEVNRRERRGEELRAQEAARPGMLDTMSSFRPVAAFRENFQNSRMFQDIFGTAGVADVQPQSAEEIRRSNRLIRSSAFAGMARDFDRTAAQMDTGGTFGERFTAMRGIAGSHGATGLGSLVGGIFESARLNDAQMNARISNLQRGGSLLQGAFNATGGEQRAAGGRVEGLFGRDAAAAIQNDFNQRMVGVLGHNAVGGAMGTANAAMRGAVMTGLSQLPGLAGMLGGSTDVGSFMQGRSTSGNTIERQYREAIQAHTNLRGADLENAVQSTMRDQLTSGNLRDLLTPAQRSAALDSINRAQGLRSPGGGTLQAAQASESAAARALMGNQAVGPGSLATGMRRAAQELSGHIRDVSRNQGKNDRSRYYITAMANASRVINDASAGPDRIREAQRMMGSLIQSLNTDPIGFTAQEKDDIRAQARSEGNRSLNDDQRAAARGFVDTHRGQTGAQTVNDTGKALTSGEGSAAVHAVIEGAAQAARGEGAMADVLRGFNAQHGSMGDIQTAMRSAGASQIAALRASTNPNDRAMANAIVQLQHATTDEGRQQAMSRAFSILAPAGREVASRRSALTAAETAHMDPLARSRIGQRVLGLFGESTEQRVERQMQRGTGSDADAAAQTGQVDATERSAQGAGIGGAADQLRSAAIELRQAARELNGHSSTQQVNDAIEANNAP